MLVPRIKNLQFNTALRGMKIPEDQLPYTEPLVADLLVTYAFDLPSMFQMATRSGIADLGIPLEEARDVAVANLQQRLPRVHAEQQGPFQRIVTGENLEACTLLIRPYWDHVAKQVPAKLSLLFLAEMSYYAAAVSPTTASACCARCLLRSSDKNQTTDSPIDFWFGETENVEEFQD